MAQNLSPLPGLSVFQQAYPGLAPGATFLSHSAAGTASSGITEMSKNQQAIHSDLHRPPLQLHAPLDPTWPRR